MPLMDVLSFIMLRSCPVNEDNDDAGLLFTTDDESYRSQAIGEPNFYHKKLTSLKRRNDDEDDMTISLLTTVWEDELVACIAESNLSKKPVPGSLQPQYDGEALEGMQNLSPRLGDHALFQSARHFTSGVLGKRQRFSNSLAFSNGFRSVSDSGAERNDSETMGNHAPDSGRQQTYLVNQQSSLLSLQNSMLNQQRELINQIRQTNERLEYQFRLHNGLDIRDPEQSSERESQADVSQPQ
ncbi:hypothetical protein O6H91_07G072400 [Diphasiastrum complanatum]|uniref:Uncharacterized protein n=1 Tax=Diphasiastrum complanatum TaxID=34168 RepID=A0ACC2D6R9_DIPCM|nr:hypothetical protein O6H91_07G072400 [Diphasiastrum complanatum]